MNTNTVFSVKADVESAELGARPHRPGCRGGRGQAGPAPDRPAGLFLPRGVFGVLTHCRFPLPSKAKTVPLRYVSAAFEG